MDESDRDWTDGELIPELRTYVDRFVAIREEIASLVAELSEEQLAWRPAPDRWSVAQNIEHLNIVGGLLVPRMDAAIERARRRSLRGEGPFRYGLAGRIFVRALRSIEKLPIDAPRAFRPARAVVARTAMDRFLRMQDELIARVHRANGIELRRVRIAAPAMRLMRFSLGTWFAAMIAHEERHLRQARRVMDEPGFPAAV